MKPKQRIVILITRLSWTKMFFPYPLTWSFQGINDMTPYHATHHFLVYASALNNLLQCVNLYERMTISKAGTNKMNLLWRCFEKEYPWQAFQGYLAQPTPLDPAIRHQLRIRMCLLTRCPEVLPSLVIPKWKGLINIDESWKGLVTGLLKLEQLQREWRTLRLWRQPTPPRWMQLLQICASPQTILADFLHGASSPLNLFSHPTLHSLQTLKKLIQ